MPGPLSQEEVNRRLDALREAKGNMAVAARALKMRPNALRNWCHGNAEALKIIEAGKSTPAPDDSKPVVDPQVVRLRDENARLKRELTEVTRDNLDAETVRETIFRLSAVSEDIPSWVPRAEKAYGKSVREVPSTIWSDWHLGEVVTKAEVNGINEFNLTVAKLRIERLVERTIDLCFHHMTRPDYPGIVVNLIGDIVSGIIHAELENTNEDELFIIVLWARDHLIAALKRMADAFGNVFVVCVAGNHGRMTRKPEAKRYIYKNADWLLYQLLERHFLEAGDSRVRFMIPAANEALYSIYGHRYLAVHGDDLGVRGGDGIIGAIGPIMRGEIKTRNSSAQMGRDYDTMPMGHWHQMLWLPRAIVNNTLKGFDEFARRFLRAVPTPPSQALWFNHPVRGITAKWEVGLDDKAVFTPQPWVAWENSPSEGTLHA